MSRQSSLEAPPVWHATSVEDALARLKAVPGGLSISEAAARLEQHGRNALPKVPGKSAWRRFLAQFDNVLIYVLLGAAVITMLLGDGVDTAVILAVVILNASIGFVQEGRAQRALDAIGAMISPRASVVRNRHRLTIDATEVVPGDILLLGAGDRVTADVRLVRARNLRIDEAALTGESVAVEKSVAPVGVTSPLAERKSMAYSGTLVTAGQGAGVVVATGTQTELGHISSLLGRVEQLETPLIRQMNEFARQLTIAILALAALTFVFAVWVRGYVFADAFMVVVGMAVAAVPEGLPAVMTITLAIGVQRMVRRRAIIRRLPAVETLGSVSTICSDKTGTLTKNEMMVTQVVLADRAYDVGGVGYAPEGGFSIDSCRIDPASDVHLMRLARAALLCNDASLRPSEAGWTVDGDPMEGALVSLGLKAGHDAEELAKDLPRLDEIPFDAAHRYMATLHHGREGGAIIYVKGAPERVIEMCACQADRAGSATIDRLSWMVAINRLAAGGHRVLAIASKSVPAGKRDLHFSDVERDLTLEGLLGLIDPPREEAIAAVAECQSAGIQVKMITGDHASTATAIAGKLGLDSPDAVATGTSLDGLDDSALRRVARTTSVFARTSPEHKLRLVQALQAGGGVVAMTGDGVNDAPALKRADIGVAMGLNGTEAAKEAADMVLADDNFASIVAAVREGRTVYDNLIKVIGWTLPTNGGETFVIIIAILFGLTLPVTPVQILWINMVTAVALGLVLAFEPAEANIMQRPPRKPNAPLLSGFLLWRVGLVSVLFCAGAFGMFSWASKRGLAHEEARTLVVNTIVVMEIFYLFSVRYLHGTSLTWQGVLGTPAVLIGVGATVALQLAFTYAPVMQRLFGTRAVAFSDGLVVIGIGIGLLVILEVEKHVRRLLIDPKLSRAELRPEQ